MQIVADDLASKIADADSWASGEGYISAIPERLREALQPFATRPPQPGRHHHQQLRRPPRVTRTQREHRLDEAMDDLQATQQVTPRDRRAVRRARRRVGRLRASMAQQELRQAFDKDES
ncbi:Reverse transcriptase, partial [Phytophthora palmivora]